MKILFLTNQIEFGGIEKNIVRLTQELSSRGHSIVTASRGGRLLSEFSEVGGRHVDIPVASNPIDMVRSAGRLADLLKREQIDVVHIFSASTAALWCLTLFFLRITGRNRRMPPAVSSVMGLQNSPTERASKTRFRVLVTSFGVRKLIIMSPAILEVVRGLPIRSDRLTHLSVVGVNVLDSDSIAEMRVAVRAELGLRPYEKAVMTIGNLEPRKSHELFIRAAAIISDKRDDVRFFIIGDGFLRDTLLQEVERTVNNERITFLGARADIDRLLAACDVYVRPGIVEGFIGITVLEAQATGVPVVSFETQDVKLAIDDDRTGRLVPLGDHAALAHAIAELLDDERLALRLGQAGRKHAEANYSMKSIVDDLLALYTEVTTRAGTVIRATES